MNEKSACLLPGGSGVFKTGSGKFGPAGTDSAREAWFRKDAAFDAAIAERFGPLVERALRGDLDDWAADPRSALARIVLLDQFPRNIFRGSARAFAGDRLALAAARAMVATGQDLVLPPETFPGAVWVNVVGIGLSIAMVTLDYMRLRGVRTARQAEARPG